MTAQAFTGVQLQAVVRAFNHLTDALTLAARRLDELGDEESVRLMLGLVDDARAVLSEETR